MKTSKLQLQLKNAKKVELAREKADEKVSEFENLTRVHLKKAIAAKGYELKEVVNDIYKSTKKPKKRNKIKAFFATLFGIKLNNDFETGFWLNFNDKKKRELLMLIVSNFNKEGKFISEIYYEC